MPLAELTQALARHGLRLRGGFATDSAADADILAVAPWAQTVILIGNVGSELWDKSGAEIAALGDPDPLDRWTRSVIEPIASSVDGLALFPFAGPPYWPFQRWAERAEGVRSSPIGIQIHPEFGLWHAYRAAILLRGMIELPRPGTSASVRHLCGSAVPDALSGERLFVDRLRGRSLRRPRCCGAI